MSASAERLTMGSALVGRYELRELLGDGAMGTVYGAFDRELEREVAVKSMLPALAADPEFVARFQREARALARLRHPNIIGLHDLIRPPEGGLYLILELVRGSSLDAEIRRDAPLSWGRCARVGIDVCRALSVAHAAGVVHRDIKPSNILIGDDGAARVADFGIAQLAGGAATTKVGVLIGTPQYFSPEQADARPATPRSDLYSLCVVLFEAATGRLPFDSDGGVLRIAVQHLNSPVPDPRTLRPGLPREAAELIMRGMSKSPDERFADAGELAAALLATLAAPMPAGPVTPVPPTAVPGRTTPPPGIPAEPAGPTRATAPGDDTVLDDTVASGRTTRTTAAAGPREPTAKGPPWQPVAAAGDPARARRTRRAAWAGAAAVAALVGVVAGLALGSGDEAEPAGRDTGARSVEAAGVTALLPAGWGPSTAGPPALGLTDAASFTPAEAPAGGSVTVGRSEGGDPSMLPATLLTRLSAPPGPGERVDLGAAQALRHTGLRAAGIDGALSVYAVPAGDGVLTVACVAPASGSADVAAACGQAATSLDLGDERVYALDPDPAYARAVAGALTRLQRGRDAGARALRAARRPAPQGAAARRISDAYGAAATALGRIDPGPVRAGAHDALVAAAQEGRRAFARMADAATAGQRTGFDLARRDAAAADRALRSSLAGLATLGYDLD